MRRARRDLCEAPALRKTGKIGPPSFWKVPVEGGDETQVVESVAPRALAISNEGVYFVTSPNATGTSSIQFFSFAAGKIKEIAEIMKWVSTGLTVSPDGRWVYTRNLIRLADLMLVENFQ